MMKSSHAILTALMLLLLAAPVKSAFSQEAKEGEFLPWGDWRVEVNEYGNLKRVYLGFGDEYIDRLEALVESRHPEPNIWQAALVLPRELTAEWTDSEGNKHTTSDKLSDEEMQFIEKEFRKFERLVYVCSGGNLKFDSRIIVLEEPVKVESENDFFFPPPFKEDLLKVPGWKPEETDSVVCIFPPGEMPLDAFGRSWGDLHGENCAGNANIGFVRQRLEDGGQLHIVMMHEWLHQAEAVMYTHLEYTGIPTLHGAGQNGYVSTELGLKQWLVWNTDLMYWYYRPDMWKKADMNSRVSVRVRPQFEGGFITDWLLLGPYANEKDEGLDTPYMKNEGSAAPDRDSKGPDGKSWKPYASPNEVVALGGQFETKQNVVAYAFSYVYSPKRQQAILWLGSDDGVKAFLNGLEVHRNKVKRGAKIDDDKVPVVLQKGWNRLMLKIDQGSGGWGFVARFSDQELGPIEGLKFSALKPDRDITKRKESIPFTWDGRYFAWEEVVNDAWAILPELSERHLRAITGNPEFSIKQAPPLLLLDPGTGAREYSAVLHENDPQDYTVNNELNARNESIAVLRFEAQEENDRFPDALCDLLLVRADAIGPWMDYLNSANGIPVKDSVIGFMSPGQEAVYVFLTYLGGNLPQREIDLVTLEQEGVKLSSRFTPAEIIDGEKTSLILSIENTSNEAAKDCEVTVVLDTRQGGKRTLTTAFGEIAPGKSKAGRIILGGDGSLPIGPSFADIKLTWKSPEESRSIEKMAAVKVIEPVGIELSVEGASIVRDSGKRKLLVKLTNNIGEAFKGEVRISGEGASIRPEARKVVMGALQEEAVLEFDASFDARGEARLSASFHMNGGSRHVFKDSLTVEMGGYNVLFLHDFEKGLDGWMRRIGGYDVKLAEGDKAISGSSVLVTDGGGSKYGNVIAFGPDIAHEGSWMRGYSSSEYPFIEFDVKTDSTSNSGVIVKADGNFYVVTLTGTFVERWGTRVEIGNLKIPADGKRHHVRFNLHEALEKTSEEPGGDHNVEMIWIGDTKSHSSNQWLGEDVNYYVIDNFSVRR